MRIDRQPSEDFLIRKGVRQGCMLAGLLFKAYLEQLFEEALVELENGIINSEVINNIRNATPMRSSRQLPILEGYLTWKQNKQELKLFQ